MYRGSGQSFYTGGLRNLVDKEENQWKTIRNAVKILAKRNNFAKFIFLKNDLFKRQAGAELGQAQIKLELDFTFIKI